MTWSDSIKQASAVPLMLILALSNIGVTSHAAAEPSTQPVAQTRIEVRFAHAIELPDAVRITSKLHKDVVAYRFESAQIVGEYSPLSGMSTQTFLEQFERELGSQPEVVGFMLALEPTSRDSKSPPVVPSVSGIKEYKAAPISEEFFNRREAQLLADSGATSESTSSSNDWRPNLVQTSIQDAGSRIYFDYALFWDSPTTPGYIPSDYGMEVGVELYNNASSSALRPNCPAGYKDAFFAKNYGWNWYVVGETYNSLPATQPYADYNDLTDPCNRNSISLGLASPQYIPLSYNNSPYDWVLFMSIDAPQGNQLSNTISGGVSLVTKDWCTRYPSYAFTDCMGVSVSGSPVAYTQRGTLNVSRNWTAPDKCWTSDDKGTTAPTLTLPTPTGC